MIELLVVVSGIALLMSIISGSVIDAQVKSKYSVAKKEMEQIQAMVVLAKLNSSQTLRSITGSGCTGCPCGLDGSGGGEDSGGFIMGGINGRAAGHEVLWANSDPTDTRCHDDWESALVNIKTAAQLGDPTDDRWLRDPWGSPYILDENEGENPADPCRQDRIISAGFDGIMANWDDAVAVAASDDYIWSLPNSSSACINP